MNFDALIASKAVWIVGALLVLFVLERMFPMAGWKGGWRRIAKNMSVASFNAVFSPFIVIPITAYAASHALGWRPEFWSGATGLIIDLLILDCWIYFWHRINHEVPLLWRFHEVHHLDETLDASSALRFHFGEVLLSSLVRASVIFLLDMPLASVVVFEVMVALAALFHHSNVALPANIERPLSMLIVTPSIHWVHHHALREDTDSNYATFLSIWDHVFGTASTTMRTPDMAIGVEGRGDQQLLRLLLRPFMRNRSTS
jgi:sterol desaturase/sphingolipid hydroxylase (fatty acid hydroxylase superfamily)